MLLVRPYPVHRLIDARQAIESAARGDVTLLWKLYRAASDALAALDPDEVDEFIQEHKKAFKDEQSLAHAAVTLADTWEGLVSIGAQIKDKADFRGFTWLAAQVRYELEPAKRDGSRLKMYARGGALPDTTPEDAALYVALPALIGLGPEFPDELAEPCPIPTTPIPALLGLSPEDDWTGVDPLDGFAILPEDARAHYAAAPAVWRPILCRGLEHGLLVRTSDLGA